MKRIIELFFILNSFVQTPIFCMHIGKVIKKQKAYTKASFKRSIATPSHNNELMNKDKRAIITYENNELSLPIADDTTLQAPIKNHNTQQFTCATNQKECMCIKQYPIMPIQNSDFYKTKDLGDDLIEAKERLNIAIELFKNDPYVAAKLIAVQNKLCPQSEHCAKRIASVPHKNFFMKTSRISGAIFVCALYSSGNCMAALTVTFILSTFVALAPFSIEKIANHNEIKNNSIMQYHTQYETHLINSVLKEIEPLLPTPSKPKKV